VLAGWARCEVDKPRRSSDLDPVPEAPGHDEGFTGPEGVALVPAWCFDHDRHLPRQQVDQFVAVGMALAEVRRWVEDGVPKAVLARKLGVSRETLYQYLRAASGSAGAGQGPAVAKSSAEVSV